MKKTLLAAGDDKAFQGIMTRLFKGTEWRVEAAEDGVTALERTTSLRRSRAAPAACI